MGNSFMNGFIVSVHVMMTQINVVTIMVAVVMPVVVAMVVSVVLFRNIISIYSNILSTH